MKKYCTFIFLTILSITTESSSRDNSSNEQDYLIDIYGKRYDGEATEFFNRGDEGCCSSMTNYCSNDNESDYEPPNDDCSFVGCFFECFCIPFMPKD